jgi:hypothetical protein
MKKSIMKQKKIKIEAATLFVYRPKNGLLKDMMGVTDPTTGTVVTVTSTHVFQK